MTSEQRQYLKGATTRTDGLPWRPTVTASFVTTRPRTRPTIATVNFDRSSPSRSSRA